jgi:hypothetical protein
MTKVVTVEDFRSAVSKTTELPACCARLLQENDELLVGQEHMKRLAFIHAIFEVVEMVFAGRAAQTLQEVGIEVTSGFRPASSAPTGSPRTPSTWTSPSLTAKSALTPPSHKCRSRRVSCSPALAGWACSATAGGTGGVRRRLLGYT